MNLPPFYKLPTRQSLGSRSWHPTGSNQSKTRRDQNGTIGTTLCRRNKKGGWNSVANYFFLNNVPWQVQTIFWWYQKISWSCTFWMLLKFQLNYSHGWQHWMEVKNGWCLNWVFGITLSLMVARAIKWCVKSVKFISARAANRQAQWNLRKIKILAQSDKGKISPKSILCY